MLDFGTVDIGFDPISLLLSALSLAKPFWPFLLLGLAFVIAPWLYQMIKIAVEAHKFTSEWNKHDAKHFGNRASFREDFVKLYRLRKSGE